MGRRHRVWYPNAMYHVTNRGIRKDPIFYDEVDRFKYFQFLEETRARYPFLIHSYCLMTNHIHLQIQTLNDPIYSVMMYLNTKYAKYFNRRYDFVGPIFQGRYGSQLINSQQYELDVSKYIHLNPVKAHLVEKPEQYPWSSYKAYVFGEKNPHVDTTRLLSYFPEPHLFLFQQFTEAKSCMYIVI